MKSLPVVAFLLALVAASLSALSLTSAASPQKSAPSSGLQAVVAGPCCCPCPAPVYVRTSSSLALSGTETLVECDTDAGLPLTVTLPLAPAHLKRLEVWLGDQPGLPGGVVTIDLQGNASHGDGLVLDAANEGRELLWVKPSLSAGGYWRVSSF